MAATEAAKEAVWIEVFITDLRLSQYHVGAVPLHIDNKSVMKLAKKPEMHARTKQVANRYHFIRQCVEDGSIELI